MDCMRKFLVFLLFIATLSYVYIYISTSASIEPSSRERRDISDRKAILPKERSLDESITRKEIDRNKKPNKTVWIRLQRSPSKTKDENYFQSFTRKVDTEVVDKMTHNEREDSLNYTMEPSLINSDANIYPKENNYTIFFEKESKIMKSISTRYDMRNADTRDGNHFQGKHKLETFSERTSQGNTTYAIQSEACKVLFDKDSLNNARQFLYQSEKQSVYLIYLHLEIQNISDFSSDYRKIDNLLNWQYVLKDQTFLVQLPVDFDVVTFNLLYLNHDETFIKLTAFYNNINCTQDSIETIESTKILLWKELFNNDTKYYLCNRHYLDETGREALYYITTIWIGYDLTCSEAPNERGTYKFDVEKDALPLVIPVAFLLSLQFVWIFALLDVGSRNLKDVENRKNSEKKASHKEKSTFCYEKGDRPFGIKRMLIKLFYCKSKCCNTIQYKLCRIVCYFYAQQRLIFLLWFFILLPIGLLRTLYRHELNTGTYAEYQNVLRTSEPIFNEIKDGQLALTMDIIYAILGPLIFIWVGACYHNAYTSKQQCCILAWCERKCTKTKDNETKGPREFTSLSDTVVSLCTIPKKWRISRILCCIIPRMLIFFPIFHIFSFRCECLQCENGDKIANERPRETSRESAVKEETQEDINRKTPVKEETQEDINRKTPVKEETQEDINRKTPVKEETQVDIDTRGTNLIPPTDDSDSSQSRNKTPVKCCKIMNFAEIFCCLICFLCTYFLCLRPILSTFTFLLRFVTYLVFVLLPIRVSLFRYTFLGVSAFLYLVKYLHEFINMNSAILDYIFEKDNEQQTDNSGTLVTQSENENVNIKTIDEETFWYIYCKLLFVKKKVYFFFSKIFIVVAYFFIIIETFLSNKDSLTSTSFKDMVEVVLVFIGPYAISLFFKGNSKDFLSDDNKKDIDIAYEQYLLSQENTTHKTHKENSNNETESTGNRLSDNQNGNTPIQSTNDSSNSDSPERDCTYIWGKYGYSI